jgi:hypothetical protein
VFSACRDRGVAVEINCRPERQDPPDDLLRLAVEIGCGFAIDTDAHAPGQLDWLEGGCRRAEQFGIGPDRVINTRAASAMTAPAATAEGLGSAGKIELWVPFRAARRQAKGRTSGWRCRAVGSGRSSRFPAMTAPSS